MKSASIRNLMWILAVVLLAAGAFLTYRSIKVIGNASLHVTTNAAYYSQLRVMDQQLRSAEAARAKVEKLPAARAESPAGFLQEAFGDVKPDDLKETQQAVAEGWIVRQFEVSFSEVPFASAVDFVSKAEAMNTPWRLAKCVFRASSVSAVGQVGLQLEHLERK